MANAFLREPTAGGDGPIEAGTEILTQVSLKSFAVTPATIGPFGAAMMRWEVDGPGPPFRFSVELNGQGVQRRGEQVVAPKASTTYVITARAFGVRAQLGSVRLTVDMSGCSTFEMLNPQTTLQGALNNAISQMAGVYHRRPPTVTFTPGRIGFQLLLGKDVNRFPDPTIRISGAFGLDIEDGVLVSRGTTVSAGVSFPWLAWAVPGAALALPIIIGNAKQEAETAGRTAISRMTALLGALWVTADGMRRHSVRVGVDRDGFGVIEATECPDTTLRRLVELAAAEFASPG